MIDPIEAYVEARARRRRQLLIGAGIIGFLALLFLLRSPLQRLLEGPPEPYDATKHVGFEQWMKETWPHFTAEASWDDPERFEAAATELLEATTFHSALRRRTRSLIDGMREFDEFSRRWVTLAKKETVQEKLNEVSDRVAAIEELLREIEAPYCLDYQVEANLKEGRWKLSMIARTARVYGVTTLRAGEQTIEVLRTERLDTLSLRDLTHGSTERGVARIGIPTIRATVVNRYLPLLHSSATLRDLHEPPRKLDLLGKSLRPAVVAMMPDELQDVVPLVGVMALERRAVLEALDETLRLYDARLIEPQVFTLTADWYERMERSLGKERHPEILARLKRFSELGDISAEERKAVAAVEGALLEQFIRAVELHEAWHVLVPEAAEQLQDGAPVPGYAANETIAYLGTYADAGGEHCLVDDQLYDAMRRARKSQRNTPTAAAVKLVAAHIALRRLDDPEETEEEEEEDDLPMFEHLAADAAKRRARQQEIARDLLREWFGEQRSIEWVSHQPL